MSKKETKTQPETALTLTAEQALILYRALAKIPATLEVVTLIGRVHAVYQTLRREVAA